MLENFTVNHTRSRTMYTSHSDQFAMVDNAVLGVTLVPDSMEEDTALAYGELVFIEYHGGPNREHPHGAVEAFVGGSLVTTFIGQPQGYIKIHTSRGIPGLRLDSCVVQQLKKTARRLRCNPHPGKLTHAQ